MNLMWSNYISSDIMIDKSNISVFLFRLSDSSISVVDVRDLIASRDC